jgi:hypothetical protein
LSILWATPLSLLLLALAGALRTAEGAARAAQAAADAASTAEAQAATSAARLERKVALLAKERDGLKSILASYDEEDASGSGVYKIPCVSSSVSAGNSCCQSPCLVQHVIVVHWCQAGASLAQQERIKGLEAANSALHAQLQKLEEEATQQQAALHLQSGQTAAAIERAEAAEATTQRLETEIDNQARQIALLEVGPVKMSDSPASKILSPKC